MKRIIDGKTVLCIQKEYSSNTTNQHGKMSKLTELVVNKKWMDQEELREVHLVAAIKRKEPIPTPDVIEIDEEIYSKLYPANCNRSKWLIKPDPLNEIVDYDLDDEDNRWLQNQPRIFNLTATNFEKFIEFLEENSKNKVPTLENFTSFFRNQSSSEALGKVFDYWLDKRLKKSGTKLIHRHKTASEKPTKNKKFDPYEAFRPCTRMMHLRKNRQVDRMNYIKMVRLRALIASDVVKYRNELVERSVQHEILKHRFQNFKEQFMRRDFSGLYLDQQPIVDRERIIKNIEKKGIVEVVPQKEEIDLESLKKHQFERSVDAQYHQPHANFFHEVTDENQNFNLTSIGLMRSRIGRGGRLIFDRREAVIKQSPCLSPEYQEVTFYGNISMTKCDSLISNISQATTSSFIPKNDDSYCTVTSIDDNNNNCKMNSFHYEII